MVPPAVRRAAHARTARDDVDPFYIHQRGVQWKHGVVIYMMLYTILLHNTTPIHCTLLPLYPPLPSIHPLRFIAVTKMHGVKGEDPLPFGQA